MSHDDDVRRLNAKFEASHRFANFGPILSSISVNGFRGVSSLKLEFKSPITALSGLNGTGKSTIVQLIACAYKTPATGSPLRSYVVDYFPESVVDPKPFTDDARVAYEYAESGGAQRLTLSRVIDRWSDYKRQPLRATYYVGLTQFLPKIEKRDFSVYGGARLRQGPSFPVTEEARRALAFVLGQSYDEANFTEVSLSGKTGKIAMVRRGSNRYSENHMGFGEGRMFYTIELLETAPEQSLFVLEEPETALHGEAQVRLAQYLVQVSKRRKHQVIITTHSASILDQLSRDSVVLLRREVDGTVSATTGLSTYQIDAYLNDHASPAATICVEDEFAKALVIEVIRHVRPDLLSGVGFVIAGDVGTLAPAVNLISRAGKRSVAISDTDQTHTGEQGVYALPGDAAPEELVFRSAAVIDLFAAEPYRINLADKLATVENHHGYAAAVAVAANVSEPAVVMEACRAWVEGCAPGHFDAVVQFVADSLGDNR